MSTIVKATILNVVKVTEKAILATLTLMIMNENDQIKTRPSTKSFWIPKSELIEGKMLNFRQIHKLRVLAKSK